MRVRSAPVIVDGERPAPMSCRPFTQSRTAPTISIALSHDRNHWPGPIGAEHLNHQLVHWLAWRVPLREKRQREQNLNRRRCVSSRVR